MEHVSAKQSVRKIDKIIAYAVRHSKIKTVIYGVAVLEATISPLVPELVVATVLSYRKDLSWKQLSVVSACGSVTGVAILYAAGIFLYKNYTETFSSFFSSGSIALYTEKILNENTFITMLVASFTPLPDRVFAFLSGVYSLNFFVVLLAFFLGRLLRVGIVAYFSYQFGDEAREYIVKHTSRALMILVGLTILYVLGKVLGIL